MSYKENDLVRTNEGQLAIVYKRHKAESKVLDQWFEILDKERKGWFYIVWHLTQTAGIVPAVFAESELSLVAKLNVPQFKVGQTVRVNDLGVDLSERYKALAGSVGTVVKVWTMQIFVVIDGREEIIPIWFADLV